MTIASMLLPVNSTVRWEWKIHSIIRVKNLIQKGVNLEVKIIEYHSKFR